MKFVFLIEYFDTRCNDWSSIGMTMSESIVVGLETAETTVRLLMSTVKNTKFRIIAVADDGSIEYEHRATTVDDLAKRITDKSLN